jgi:membrane-bound serine protease (ClpP class)
VLKEKGELLSLTASEASQTYGDPAQPLLAAGIAKDVDELLAKKFGAQGYELRRLEITWSENLAQYLTAISPLLMGLGMLALFIEFKTPGFGIFGITGITLLAVVFLSNYAAGLSGHEPMIVFGIGLILLVVEVFFFPGVMVMALAGLLLMFGALVWSLADIWPNQPLTLSGDLFLKPLEDVGLGVGLAVILAVILVRFLPHSLFWDRLVLAAPTGPQILPSNLESVSAVVGQRGVAATALMPSGQVQVGGARYEARVEVGSIEQGAEVVVVRRAGFSLIVEKADA